MVIMVVLSPTALYHRVEVSLEGLPAASGVRQLRRMWFGNLFHSLRCSLRVVLYEYLLGQNIWLGKNKYHTYSRGMFLL